MKESVKEFIVTGFSEKATQTGGIERGPSWASVDTLGRTSPVTNYYVTYLRLV